MKNDGRVLSKRGIAERNVERKGLRAWGYEMRLEEGKGRELARECWNEMRKRTREGKSIEGWEEDRKEFFEKRNWSIKIVEKLREEGKMRKEEI